MNSKTQQAALEYVARKKRQAHPSGRRDNGGRWHPHNNERRECCDRIRTPSRAFPYSLMLHCRTAQHVASLYGVGLKELKKEIRKINPPEKHTNKTYYKLVAVDGDKYLSVYDGKTEYKLLEKTECPIDRGDHNGGLYCYDNTGDALGAVFPNGSKLLHARKALLSLRVSGKIRVYKLRTTKKYCFSSVIPLAVRYVTEKKDYYGDIIRELE